MKSHSGPKQPSSAQSSRARPPSLTGEPRLSVLRSCPRALTPSLPLPGRAGLSAPDSFARAPMLSLCPAGLTRQRCEPFPPRTHSLSLHRGAPCQLRLPRKPQWTSAHARRELRSHRLPTRSNSLLSTARTRSLSPTSFHPRPLSLVLYRGHQRPLDTRARCAGHPNRQEPRPVYLSTISR